MKRKPNYGDVLTFTKTGGGTLRLVIGGKTRIIKPNQTFSARLEDIPERHRDTLIVKGSKSMEELAKEETRPPTPKEVVKAEYFVKHRGGGWYDVVDSSGKVVNEKAIKKTGAEELMKSLKDE